MWKLAYAARQALAWSLAPALCGLGARFGRDHRRRDSLVYRTVDTVLANRAADLMAAYWPEARVEHPRIL